MLDAPGATATPFEATPYIPPKAPRLPDDASFFARIRASIGNPVSAFPEALYRDRYVVQKGGGPKVAYVCDPEILEDVLVKRAKDFSKTEINARVFRPAMGEGLLSAEGEDWRWKRRLAAPTFSPAALAKLAPAFVAPFERLAADWSASAKTSGRDGLQSDVSADMVAATMDVIERVLFADPSEMDQGLIVSELENYLRPLSWVAVGVILGLPSWTPYPGMISQFRARDRLRGAVLDVVQRRRAALEQGKTPPGDITSSLLLARDPETDRPLSDQDMVDMLLTLVAAGHETTAHTMSWALYCLAHQPRLQDALAAEAREAAAGGALTADAMAGLARTEAAVKETLRLFPVAPLMARTCRQDEALSDMEPLPAGSMVSVPIYAIQRNSLYWERPDEFDIGRFLNRPDPPRTLYMPFGAGPRICIGARMAMMEATLGLAAMLRKVRFEPCAETEFDPLHRVTLRPRNGLMLRVAPRPLQSA